MKQEDIEKLPGIATGMIVGFGASFLLNNAVFLADSPRLRPNIVAYVQKQLIFLPGTENVAADDGEGRRFEGVAVDPVSDGVYRGDGAGTMRTTVVAVDEVEWQTYTYLAEDGTEVTIKVPAGEAPPQGVAAEDLDL